MYVGGWSGRDCWCAFVTHGLVFLNYRLKVNSKLSHTPPFGECVPSGTPLRMYFIKLHWFVLSAPKGYLFTNPFICYIPFQPYAGSKYWSADENTKLTNCLRSALTLWGILCRKEMESKLKKWLGIIFEKHVVLRDADMCGWSQAAWYSPVVLHESIFPWVKSMALLQHYSSSFRKSLRWRKIKIPDEQSIFWLFSSDECGCQIGWFLKYV